MLLFGDPIDAEEAYRVGLVNRVVPSESLIDEAKNGLRPYLIGRL